MIEATMLQRATRRPLALLLAVSLATAPVIVQTRTFAGEAEDKATARDLAKEGIAAEEAGDCVVAIDKLERAEKLFHAPIHLQHLARCYSKQGRVVEASEVWRKLSLENLPPNAPQLFKDAVTEAKTELPKVEARIAHLTISVKGTYPDLAVTMDGKPIPTAALDVSRATDPGQHAIRATATGFAPAEATVTLKDGESNSVKLELSPGTGGGGDAGIVEPTTDAAPPSDASLGGDQTPSKFPWRTAGLVVAGVGGAMLIGGVITGLAAKSKFKDLEDKCPDRKCQPGYDLSGAQSSVRTLQTTTNILLIGGGVLAVAGITTFLLTPSPKKNATVAVQFAPIFGGGHVELTGSF
jgi:pentatricopeptide repeat protein